MHLWSFLLHYNEWSSIRDDDRVELRKNHKFKNYSCIKKTFWRYAEKHFTEYKINLSKYTTNSFLDEVFLMNILQTHDEHFIITQWILFKDGEHFISRPVEKNTKKGNNNNNCMSRLDMQLGQLSFVSKIRIQKVRMKLCTINKI